MSNWRDPTYLKTGAPRQISAYYTLQCLGVFETLKKFDPVLVGTIPIDIDIPGSDLDIICHAADMDAFQYAVQCAYKKMPDFLLRRNFIEGVTSIVARFAFNEFQIEIFGQALPIEEQRAYRHMIIEARLLDLFGDRARSNIRKIKLSGLKTEPAFGRHFRLVGDPYKALLELEDLSDNDLLMRFSYDIEG